MFARFRRTTYQAPKEDAKSYEQVKPQFRTQPEARKKANKNFKNGISDIKKNPF